MIPITNFQGVLHRLTPSVPWIGYGWFDGWMIGWMTASFSANDPRTQIPDSRGGKRREMLSAGEVTHKPKH